MERIASVNTVIEKDIELKQDAQVAPVLIAGAGIGGLVLALALHKKCGLAASDIEVFEQAKAFNDNAGGAMGLYANGLRVLRDIDDGKLLAAVREAGYDYLYRRWQRHDGTEVACALESKLTDEAELQSIGIRRWKLQKCLTDAAAAAGIVVTFQKRTESVVSRPDGKVEVKFADGTMRVANLVFGADGLKSKVREAVLGEPLPAEFTGVTCLMGAAKVGRPVRGICFPSSSTTKNHGCFYPTGEHEQIFQLYFPAKTTTEAWGTLSPEEGTKQCHDLAEKLEADGWDEAFLAPLRQAEAVIRVGLYSRDPLDKWASDCGRIALLGDAAHPPVPYIGQGAMMAIEDVGILVRLLKHHCCNDGASKFDFSASKLMAAMADYQAMRIPRTRQILGSSHKLGATQQMRADSWVYNLKREWSIRLQVWMNGTLSTMKPGPAYDFAKAVEVFLKGDEAKEEEKEEKAKAEAAAKASRALYAGFAAATAVVATAAVVLARRK